MTDDKIILDWSKPLPVKRWPTAPAKPEDDQDLKDGKGTPAAS